jgi:Domain of unknown function (DUF4143)
VDPFLAVAALAAGPERLLADLDLLESLFESLVVRDLRVLTQPLDGTVLHYRDNYGVEADAVIRLADGRWAAFEVKLGGGLVDEGADALLRFRAAVDTRKSGEPAVLAVVRGRGLATCDPTASPSSRSGRSRRHRLDIVPVPHGPSSKRASRPWRRLSANSLMSNSAGSNSRPSQSRRSSCSG